MPEIYPINRLMLMGEATRHYGYLPVIWLEHKMGYAEIGGCWTEN